MSKALASNATGRSIPQERGVIRVRAPQANAGVGEALRRAFTPPAKNGVDREFARLLELI